MSNEESSQSISLHVFAGGQRVYQCELSKPLEMGRQRSNERPPFYLTQSESKNRLIIATHVQTDISRTHLIVEPWAGNQVKVTNLTTIPLTVEPGESLGKDVSCCVTPPLRIQLPGITVRIESTSAADSQFSALKQPPLPPPRNASGDGSHLLSASGANSLIQTLGSSFDTAQGEVLLQWLRSTALVFQNAASSPHFLPLAVQAVHQIVGLQYAVALTYENDRWAIKSEYGEHPGKQFRLSTRLLDKLLQEKRTFVYRPEVDTERLHSLVHVEAVVAAPILDELGDVTGALYATKISDNDPMSVVPDISTLEASLVELIASGVAAGWARLRHEQAAIKARIQFEQFFGPDLAAKLETDPNLLKGRDTDITVMFCDVVGFSRISEKFNAALTLEWINEVLGVMSECVIREGGVLVDYVGDELMAMWGAPFEYRDHALRAVRAARQIRINLAALSEQWFARLGEHFSVCTGINTGVARVGNVGSSWKFKYGALGNTVNLGARVRGLTKQVKCETVVTKATVKELPSREFVRRLGRVQVINIDQPLEVYELMAASNPQAENIRQWYESALHAFEHHEVVQAQEKVAELLRYAPQDGPGNVLASRIDRVLNQSTPWSPVWKLETK